jgi:hypothetical protein
MINEAPMRDLPGKLRVAATSPSRSLRDSERMRDRASRWRLRALEMRATADEFMTEEARDAMNRAADGWDNMAAAAEEKAGRLTSVKARDDSP